MAYYRVLTNLSKGKEVLKIGVHDLNFSDEHLRKLIDLGLIAPISTPPLKLLPLVQHVADKLETFGIITISDFLKADYDILKNIWIKRDVQEKYKQDLIDTYLIVKKDKDCNC